MRTYVAVYALVFALISGCAQMPPTPIQPLGTLAQTKEIVVLDIDGTLTPHNLSVFEARPDSDKVVAAYVRKGYKIIYVTTRVPGFQSQLAAWLERHNLPSQPVHIAQTHEERKNPAAFKANILRAYVKAGWQLAYGYGDSATDFLAYLSVGIPQARIFALKRKGSEECEGGGVAKCLDNWTEHIDFVENEVPNSR